MTSLAGIRHTVAHRRNAPANSEAAEAYLDRTVCVNDEEAQLIEVRYVPYGATEVTRRWDLRRRKRQDLLREPWVPILVDRFANLQVFVEWLV